MSQDRDEIHFCTGLLTGLYIVGVFHTVQQPDKKMSIFQKKRASIYYCNSINNFSQLYGCEVIEKLCYFTLKYFSFPFSIIYLPCFDYLSVV